ncbi:hypothetical protein PTTW11_08907 [Pyrenophora teres f. teres]|uniref:Uncharacterized protein n=1 Tax=Pyrenophora teres f. teres TaxID=97479 RepID=A0A6S6WBL3_9PLEO|nr:hypothetical protein PTTW11_08907 [Pyrenophora teres f. teres]
MTAGIPPKGLSRISRHHLARSSLQVQPCMYNAMDYQDDELAPGATEGAGASIVDERARRKQEKKEMKEMRRRKKEAREAQDTNEAEKVEEEAPTPPADQAPATPVKKGRYGPRNPYKKREKGPDGKPVSSMKRKREGDAHVEKAAVTEDKMSSGMCFLRPSFLQDLKESMGNPGFTSSPKIDDTGNEEKAPKKKGKGRPPGAVKTAIPESGETKTTQAEMVAKNSIPSELAMTKRQKQNQEERVDTGSLEKTFKMIKTPIPIPSVASMLLSGTRKTSALPSEPRYDLDNSTSEPQPKKSKPTKPESQVFVPDTPPSQGKSRLRTPHRAVSIATDMTSSGTSSTTPSIKDMFLRIGKPYTNPFFTEPKKPSQHIERHPESSLAVFTAAFTTVRATVNFTDEKEYVIEHDALVAASSGRLPCLHKVTGCTPKGEEMLRLSCEENAWPVLKMANTSEAEAKAACDAISRCQTAECLLRHTIAAYIPVPLGVIEGIWSLYCPGYSARHVDRYGFGKRTLTVFETAGASKHEGVYTARLLLLPRSISFAMGDFVGPPHASFRHVELKTVPEGYRVEIVFLGNGYAKVRLDMHLLLTGRVATAAGEKREKSKTNSCSTGIFEFLAVHQKAVVWMETSEGRKTGTKHDS